MKRIYIIGSGGSLRGFDFRRIQGFDCMAINHMIQYVPFAKHFVSVDNIVYDKFETLLSNLNCEKHAVIDYSDTPAHARLNVRRWAWRNSVGFDQNPYVCHNWNSGLTGLNIAVNLGYKDIRLLGFDADDSYCWTNETEPHQYIIDKCEIIKDCLPMDVTVRNYSINSNITAFERRELKQCVIYI